LNTGFDDDFSPFVGSSSETSDIPSDDQISASRDAIFGTQSTYQRIGSDVDDDTENFDLSAVFGRLQMLKQEADRIEDPEERRRFAERVALGFLAGLSDEDDDSDAA
jgi:hypothetical protein